jgi:hypothetical protein
MLLTPPKVNCPANKKNQLGTKLSQNERTRKTNQLNMNSQISHIHNQIVRNPETDRERHLDYKEN